MFGNLKKTEIFCVWLLHLACMKAIKNKTQAMMCMHNNHSLSIEGNKQTLQPHQVIDTMIDPDVLHFLNEWQGINPVPDGMPPIVV